MKTATLPTIRVDEALRSAVEGALVNGETLTSFMEESLRMNLARKKARQKFVSRGLNSRDEARSSRDYISSLDVLKSLDELPELKLSIEALLTTHNRY